MNVAVIAGGIGAAKLIEGMALFHDHDAMNVIVNVGDDTEMHGLQVCPDFDTIAYTLAGIVDPVRRWGIADETYHCLDMLGRYYEQEPWFNLGDKDLATHVFRTHLLRQGQALDTVAITILRRLGVSVNVAPCTNDPVRTAIETVDGRTLDFQHYFVKERANPVIKRIVVRGASDALPSPVAARALNSADGILICPSNPYLSIDPVLAVPGIRDALMRRRDVVAFVSPIVGGEAIKGPTAKIMHELGVEPSCVGVAEHYREVASIAIIDTVDKTREQEIHELGFTVSTHDTIMDSRAKKASLARHVMSMLGELVARP